MGLDSKMREQKTQMWVHPEFKKKLKVKASQKGLPIIKFTEQISTEELEEFFKYDKNRKFRI